METDVYEAKKINNSDIFNLFQFNIKTTKCGTVGGYSILNLVKYILAQPSDTKVFYIQLCLSIRI